MGQGYWRAQPTGSSCSGSMGVTSDAVLAEGTIIQSLNNTYPVTYNTSLVKGADIPKKWEDLLDPKWRDNLLVENRLFPLGYLATDWEEKVVDFATKLKAQQPKYVQELLMRCRARTLVRAQWQLETSATR